MQKPDYDQDAKSTIRRHGATLTADPIRVKAKGTIEWTCDDGDFCVVIYKDDGECLDEGRVLHGREGRPLKANVRAGSNGSNEKTYRYVVAAYVNGKVYAEDPEIVVGPQT